jgi:hypothetical protein
MLLAISLVGCADPAFQQYVQQRQVAIARMPNGPQKFYEQARLDEQILVEKQLEQQRAATAALIIAQGMQNAGERYSRAAYTDPFLFQKMQAARPSTLGTALTPVQVKVTDY